MSSILKPVLGSQLQIGHRLTRGLVGCWLMNEGGGNIVQDLSGNGYNGTIITPTWKTGKSGPALDTTTEGHHVDINQSTPFNLSELTVVASVNLSTTGSGQTRDDIVSKEGDLAGWALRFADVGNDFEMISRTGGTWQVATQDDQSVANRWYHLVGQYNASSTYLWIDAVLRGSDSGGAYTGDSSDVWIGANPYTGDTREFNGLISYVMIYNRFLIPSEIAQLYQEPFCMFERDPIELWVGSVGAGAPPTGIPIFRRRRAS